MCLRTMRLNTADRFQPRLAPEPQQEEPVQIGWEGGKILTRPQHTLETRPRLECRPFQSTTSVTDYFSAIKSCHETNACRVEVVATGLCFELQIGWPCLTSSNRRAGGFSNEAR